MKRILALYGVAALVLSACATTPQAVRPSPGALGPPLIQEGLASWYGRRFHGRKTASGERFNLNNLTCAHRTLPFGTKVKVTNLSNGREVVVTVNDRGPFYRSRIIDLSYQAAKHLDFIRAGTVPVQIQVVSAVNQPRSGVEGEAPSYSANSSSLLRAAGDPQLDAALPVEGGKPELGSGAQSASGGRSTNDASPY